MRSTANANRFLPLGLFCLIGAMVANCTSSSIEEKGPSLSTTLWERMGPGGGGSTFIPTFSYQSPDKFLIRCDMTGSYLTIDGGNSYQQINFANGASCFAFDPNDSNVVYAGALTLNKSIDGGKTWEEIFPATTEIKSRIFFGDHAELDIETFDSSLYVSKIKKIGTIRVDPMQRGALYFTMGSYFFYTSNGGQTWAREDIDEQIEYLYCNTTMAKNEVYIFSSDVMTIFNKTNKTISRRKLPKPMSPAFSFTAGTIKNSGIIIFYALHHDVAKQDPYSFVHSEVWTSTDLGVHWSMQKDRVLTNLQPTDAVGKKTGNKPSLAMIACAENDAANAYLVTNNYEEKKNDTTSIKWYGALKTGDAGKNWNWVWKGGGGSGQYGVQDAEDAANLHDAWTHKAFGGEFIQLLDAGVSPQDGNIAIVTDWYRTMKTINGGKTWNEIYSKENADGTYTSRGMDVTTCYGVHFDPFDSNHIAISYTDIGYHHSYNGGKSWGRSVAGVPSNWVNTCYWVVFDPAIKNKMWSVWSGLHDLPRGKMTRNPGWKESAYAKGGVCVSTDGGKIWQPSSDGMGLNSPTTSIVLDPVSKAGNRTLYASVYNKGVFKSVDDGKTWALKNKGIDSNTAAFELTIAKNGNLFLIVSPVPQHINGKKGREIYSGAVYRSTDGAETWTKLNVNNGMLFPNGIAIDPANPNRIYLAGWAGISLADLVGSDIAMKTPGDNLAIDMPGGIVVSEDGGNIWVSVFDKKQYVYDVTVDPYHPGRLYCNTFNKAAYRSDDYGKSWKRIKGYDFHWGHRIVIDENNHEKIYITTYGSSVWHGMPEVE
jgi:hypothetical protein